MTLASYNCFQKKPSHFELLNIIKTVSKRRQEDMRFLGLMWLTMSGRWAVKEQWVKSLMKSWWANYEQWLINLGFITWNQAAIALYFNQIFWKSLEKEPRDFYPQSGLVTLNHRVGGSSPSQPTQGVSFLVFTVMFMVSFNRALNLLKNYKPRNLAKYFIGVVIRPTAGILPP